METRILSEIKIKNHGGGGGGGGQIFSVRKKTTNTFFSMKIKMMDL